MFHLNQLTEGMKHAAHQVNSGWHALLNRASTAITHFKLHPDKLHQSQSVQWGVLSCEMTDDDEAIHLKLEVPGIEQDDLHVDIKGQLLVISGERRYQHDTSNKHYLIQERAFGSFSRQFMLPEKIDADHAKASYKNGLLSLYIPKQVESSRSRKIPVSS